MRIQFFVEIVQGVIEPDVAFLKEPVEGVPVEAEEHSELILGEPMRAIGFNSDIFKGGARRILPRGDELLHEVVR